VGPKVRKGDSSEDRDRVGPAKGRNGFRKKDKGARAVEGGWEFRGKRSAENLGLGTQWTYDKKSRRFRQQGKDQERLSVLSLKSHGLRRKSEIAEVIARKVGPEIC